MSSTPAEFEREPAAPACGGTARLEESYEKVPPQVGTRKWVPNPGPQTSAYYSRADVLLYGGQGGGGKSDLGLGLAFCGPHRRALILRRKYVNLGGLIDRAKELNGGIEGFNGSPPPKFSLPDRLIMFGANQHPGDEQNFQGIPFDLKVFDEAAQFLEALEPVLARLVVRREAAAVHPCRIAGGAELDRHDLGGGVRQQLAVVADVEHGLRCRVELFLEPALARHVEVVVRLVQQEYLFRSA